MSTTYSSVFSAFTKSGTGFSAPIVGFGLCTAIIFGNMVGTGGLTDSDYLNKRQGYKISHFDTATKYDSVAERTSIEDLGRIKEIFRPTVSDLANAFDVSRQTIYNWLAGEIPSLENADRLADLARAADVLAAEGIIDLQSQALRRKIASGKTIIDIVRDGGSAYQAIHSYVLTARRDTEQRKLVSSRLAGRNIRKPSPTDFGTPMLTEA